jgi:hypothetical protein
VFNYLGIRSSDPASAAPPPRIKIASRLDSLKLMIGAGAWPWPLMCRYQITDGRLMLVYVYRTDYFTRRTIELCATNFIDALAFLGS